MTAKFTDNNDLVDAAIDGEPRQRSAFSEESLANLTDQVEAHLEERARIVREFAKADRKMTEQGMSERDRRKALRFAEADDDGANDRDKSTKAWLQQAGSMHAALEDTLGAVLTCITVIGGGDDGLKTALAMFESQFASDKRVHATKGREMLKSYPGWTPKSTLPRRWS